MACKTLLMKSIREKALQADKTLLCLKEQYEQIRKYAVSAACAKEEEHYKAENDKLKLEVAQLKAQLIAIETRNGLKQVPLPDSLKSSQTPYSTLNGPVDNLPQEKLVKEQKPAKAEKPQQENKVEKSSKKGEKNAKIQSQPQLSKADKSDNSEPPSAVDVSKLNMKVGKIVAVDKHPDADSLYVERVDLGEGKERVIISGLVKHVPIEQMQGRLAVFLTNLKPAKMRGILSEGMIMCANVPDKVEILEPPTGAEVGDRVTVDGYPGEPDEVLNPKKKTWESIMPDLQANGEGFATYKGALWKIEGKGHVKAPTVRNAQIK